MKRFLTSVWRQARGSAQLAALFYLSVTLCRAQDASCKVVADASNLMARTPHHVYSTENRDGRSIESESISTPNGVYWETKGVWHNASTSIQEFTRQTADSVREFRDCHRVGDELNNGQPAAKYSLHNNACGANETVLLSRSSGLILKSEALIPSRHISSRYEYSNVQAPPMFTNNESNRLQEIGQ